MTIRDGVANNTNMLNKVNQKSPESEKLYNEFLASLTKKQDREIFNLEPLEGEPSPESGNAEK